MDAEPAENAPTPLPTPHRFALGLSAAIVLGAIALGILHDVRELQRPPNIHLEPLLRGQEYFEADAYPEALREFEIAAKILPTDPSPSLALATTFLELGDPESQLRAVRQAVRRAPDDPRVQLALGTVLGQRGDSGAAIEALERCLELDASNLDARINLGIVELQAGRPAKALGHLEAALTLDPTNNTAQAASAQARAKLKRAARRGPQS